MILDTTFLVDFERERPTNSYSNISRAGLRSHSPLQGNWRPGVLWAATVWHGKRFCDRFGFWDTLRTWDGPSEPAAGICEARAP